MQESWVIDIEGGDNLNEVVIGTAPCYFNKAFLHQLTSKTLLHYYYPD